MRFYDNTQTELSRISSVMFNLDLAKLAFISHRVLQGYFMNNLLVSFGLHINHDFVSHCVGPFALLVSLAVCLIDL